MVAPIYSVHVHNAAPCLHKASLQRCGSVGLALVAAASPECPSFPKGTMHSGLGCRMLGLGSRQSVPCPTKLFFGTSLPNGLWPVALRNTSTNMEGVPSGLWDSDRTAINLAWASLLPGRSPLPVTGWG